MKDYIYRLYEVESNKSFYIGRTLDPKRRITEHRCGAKNYKPGDEDKYELSHYLDLCDIKWDLEVIMECGPNTEYFEDYFINKYRLAGCALTNMRGGDDGPWMGCVYHSPDEFVKVRKKCIDEQNRMTSITARLKSRLKDSAINGENQHRTTKHTTHDTTTTRFVDDNVPRISQGLQDIMNRRSK